MGNDNYMDYDDAKFQKMTNEQYMDYQQSTMSKRMKKKRKFDVFSSGSNSSLYSILTNAETFRVPYYALFYVRIDHQILNASKPKLSKNSSCQSIQSQDDLKDTNNAFKVMMMGSKAMNRQYLQNEDSKEPDDADEVMSDSICFPIKEECSITSFVSIQSDWVTAYNSFDCADNIAWKAFNADAKIHEYQINSSHGITLLNLDKAKTQRNENNLDLKQYEEDIKKWVLDHRYSGFILDETFYFFQPQHFWNLIDDHKTKRSKQTLISDLFGTNQSKPNYNGIH